MNSHLSDPDLNALIDSGCAVLGLAPDPGWRPTIRQHLRGVLQAGLLVAAAGLPDAAEPAELFVP